jgi:hypothetical protein
MGQVSENLSGLFQCTDARPAMRKWLILPKAIKKNYRFPHAFAKKSNCTSRALHQYSESCVPGRSVYSCAMFCLMSWSCKDLFTGKKKSSYPQSMIILGADSGLMNCTRCTIEASSQFFHWLRGEPSMRSPHKTGLGYAMQGIAHHVRPC